MIQVYAPTSDAAEPETEKFYDSIKKIIEEETGEFIVVIGDYNAKVGKTENEARNVGGRGWG